MSNSNEVESAPRFDLGGVALENGLLLQGPKHWVLAVVSSAGDIKVSSGRRPVIKGPLSRLPFLRGLARLAETLAMVGRLDVGAKRSVLPSNLKRMAGATLLSIGIARILRSRALPVPLVLRELAVALLSVIPAAAATTRGASLGRYHAVEHKAVSAYQSTGGASFEALAAAPREHPRCGSNLAALLIGTTAITGVVARRISPRLPVPAQMALGAANLAASLEIFRWAVRNRGNPLANLLLEPGMRLQHHITTDEPTEKELAVGQAALSKLLELEMDGGARK